MENEKMKKSAIIALSIGLLVMSTGIISCGEERMGINTEGGGSGTDIVETPEPSIPEIPTVGHTHELKYIDGVEAGCENGGYSEYWHCDVCGKIFDEEGNETVKIIIPATGHEYETRKEEETCTTNGYTEHKCTKCGETYRDEVTAAQGHEYEETGIIRESTCEIEGVMKYECKHCGEEKAESIAKKGHRYEITVSEATCTEKGYIKYTCEECGEEKTEVTEESLGHDYIEIRVSATCESAGYVEYECVVCGDKYREITEEATGHEYGVREVKAPTCTEDGYTVYNCEVCGEEHIDDITEAKGHDWNAVTIITEATCGHYGEAEYGCGECGATKTERTEKKDHEYGTGWEYDETRHWHEAYCECEYGEMSEHIMENGECIVCGYGERLEYEENEDGTLTVIGLGSVSARDVAIPSEYRGKAVTRIADGAFKDEKRITSVKIGENVEYIGNEAFYGCTALRNIEFEEKDGWYCARSSDATTGTKLTITSNVYLELTGGNARIYYYLRKTDLSV